MSHFTSKKHRPKRVAFRLLLEALEDRTLPSATVFDARHLLVRFAPGAAPVLAAGMTLAEN